MNIKIYETQSIAKQTHPISLHIFCDASPDGISF